MNFQNKAMSKKLKGKTKKPFDKNETYKDLYDENYSKALQGLYGVSANKNPLKKKDVE